jgi:hypothetical protein
METYAILLADVTEKRNDCQISAGVIIKYTYSKSKESLSAFV